MEQDNRRRWESFVNDSLASVPKAENEQSVVTQDMLNALSAIYHKLCLGNSCTKDECLWMYFLSQALLKENLDIRKRLDDMIAHWMKSQIDREKPSLARYAR